MKGLALGLIALIFISKFSLEWTGLVPFSGSYFIFQHGLHPYINGFLNILLGVPLLALWLPKAQAKEMGDQHLIFKLLLSAFATVLAVQTLVQIFFVHPEQSAFFQVSGLGLTLLLFLVYGVVIPRVLGVKRLVDTLWAWCAFSVLASLGLFLVMPELAYKGGRFIGVFKHIPYMVTAATICFILTLPKIFMNRARLQRVFLHVLLLGLSFYAILLTGTRSSVFAALLAIIVLVFFLPTPSVKLRFAKTAATALGLSFVLFFGPAFFEHSYAVVRGEQAMMGRAAQDGIASRWEEVERGLGYFEQHPFSGLGLLYKFMGEGGEGAPGVSSYNSFKDPHNVFVSAGVIGGWPLLFLSVVGFVILSWGTVVRLFDQNLAMKWMAVYVLVHLPILLIYHAHLSVGGMADRVYWLAFGAIALVKLPNDEI